MKERKTNRTQRMRRRRKKKSFYPPLLLYRDLRLGKRKNDEDYSSLTHILPREVQRIKQIWIEMKTCAFNFSNDPSTLERQGRHRGNTEEYSVEGILKNTGWREYWRIQGGGNTEEYRVREYCRIQGGGNTGEYRVEGIVEYTG